MFNNYIKIRANIGCVTVNFIVKRTQTNMINFLIPLYFSTEKVIKHIWENLINGPSGSESS